MGLKHLTALQQLQHLSVSATSVTETRTTNLSASLPKCEIGRHLRVNTYLDRFEVQAYFGEIGPHFETRRLDTRVAMDHCNIGQDADDFSGCFQRQQIMGSPQAYCRQQCRLFFTWSPFASVLLAICVLLGRYDVSVL